MTIFRNFLGIIIGLLATFVATLLSILLIELIFQTPFMVGIKNYILSNPSIEDTIVALTGACFGSFVCSIICSKNKAGYKIGVLLFGLLLIIWAILDIVFAIFYSTFNFDFLWGKFLFAACGALSIYFELNPEKRP